MADAAAVGRLAGLDRLAAVGVALATVAATAVAGLLCVAFAFRLHPGLRLRRADFRPDARLVAVAILPPLLGWLGVCLAPAAAWTAATALLAAAWLRERRRFPDA